MDNKTTGFLCGLSLSAGVLAGAMLTYKKLETIYQDKLREDLDEARENRRRFFMRKTESGGQTVSKKEAVLDERGDIPSAELCADDQKGSDAEKEPEKASDKPYIISPEEFGEMDEYERIVLLYHTDGVLTDEDREMVDDADEIVGTDYADRLEKSDSVYVRNDERKSDYEILRVLDSYKDILEERPWLNEL